MASNTQTTEKNKINTILFFLLVLYIIIAIIVIIVMISTNTPIIEAVLYGIFWIIVIFLKSINPRPY